MSNKCPICWKELEENDHRVTGNDRAFHAACFKCETCKRSLVGDLFTEEVQTLEVDMPDMIVPIHADKVQVFCVACTKKNKYKSCFGCKQRFEVTSTIIRAHRHSWHPHCFTCAGCGEAISLEFFVRDGKHYCPKPTCGGSHLRVEQPAAVPGSENKVQGGSWWSILLGKSN